MSYDARILDPAAPVTVEVRCYRCSIPVLLGGPIRADAHVDCRLPDGSLPVSVKWDDNLELEVW